MSFFGGSTQGSQGGLQSALLAAIASGQAQGAINDKYGQAAKVFTEGPNYYAPYIQGGEKGYAAYQDALGLNGAEGGAAAQDMFRTSPGYQFQLGQGLQAVDRGASAKGLLNSGNAALALQNYGQGLADQEWGNWLDRLAGVSSSGLSAAQGGTARQGAEAGIYTGQGNALANAIIQPALAGAGYMQEGNLADIKANQEAQGNLMGGLFGLGAAGVKGYFR